MWKSNHLRSLTNRELELLLLLAEGLSNKQIATRLCLTVRTVKFHTSNIYSKLRVSSRSEAVAWLWQYCQVRDLPESLLKNCTKVQYQ